MNPPKIIAEIGCNHKGDLEVAEEMIGILATFCKADYAKFQKRNNRELLTPAQYAAPHPNPVHAYGTSYGEHREFLEFTLPQHRRLKECCEQFGIGYASSVWDLTSAKEIASLKPVFIKVPSATNQHMDLLDYLCAEYGGEIHVSLGMTTRAEEEGLVRHFQKRGRARDVVLYSCTSGYPVAFDDVCLGEIPRLIEAYGAIVKQIGFSGHHLGIAADIAAQALGASWIERHFTLDRTWKGTDHSASLEPDGLRRLVRDTKAVARTLARRPSELLEVELPQREKLKWDERLRQQA